MNKKFYFMSLLVGLMFSMMTFTSCKDDDPQRVTCITFDQQTVTLTIGESAPLAPIVVTNKTAGMTFTWASSNTAVATVDANGLVTAVAAGEATITVTANDGSGSWATCQVKVVKKVPRVTTAPTATEGDIFVGSNTALVTAGVAEGGTMMYKVTSANDAKPTSTEGFSSEVPTAANCIATAYSVWYYVKGSADYSDSEIAGPVAVTVIKIPSTVTTAPTAKTDIVAGSSTPLVEAGTASGGTMMYKVTPGNEAKPTSTEGFSAEVPTASNRAEGAYNVWYYVMGDDTHADSEIAGPVSVTIQSAVIALSAVTTADINKIVTTDGYIYASTSDVPTGKTAAAKIAYVSSTGHGLALALADESGFMQWLAAKNACSGHTPAVSGGTWSLPTKDQWTNMMTTAGGYNGLCLNFGLEWGDNAYYWSITETDGNLKAWILMGPQGQWNSYSKELTLRARAVLAF